MPADDNKLNADVSPAAVDVKKKKTRRLNNMPLIVTLLIVGAIALVMFGVMYKRLETRGRGRGGNQDGGGSAKNQARDVLSGFGEGGIAEGRQTLDPMDPEPQQSPATPPPSIETKPAPPERIVVAGTPTTPQKTEPEKPAVDAELQKARRRLWEKRIRDGEAALNSLIDTKPNLERSQGNAGIQAEINRVQNQLAVLGGSVDGSYEQRVALTREALGSPVSATPADYTRTGDLTRMKQFGEARPDRWDHSAELKAPPRHMKILRTGAVIPATLISGINSDLPGQIIGQVSQDVYDTPTGKYVLIPQGSRLVGEYASNIQYGQSRVFAVWQRVIFPDGKALDLGAMPASSGAGYAGLRDRVNNHYLRIFGSAIMMSFILAGVEMTQESKTKDSGNENTTRMSDALSESLGQSLGGVMAEMLNRNMSIAPTLEIRPGFRLNVMLVKDLVFDTEYRAFDYAR